MFLKYQYSILVTRTEVSGRQVERRLLNLLFEKEPGAIDSDATLTNISMQGELACRHRKLATKQIIDILGDDLSKVETNCEWDKSII
jgi:hypothetical protein